MAAVGVIPARLASSRLPRKVLADINGRPLLWHVWQCVSRARRLQAVYVATDSEEVRAAVEEWGGTALMTSPDCRSGTERIASTLEHLPGDFILNVQGDEPLLDPALLDALVACWEQKQEDLVTPVYSIRTPEDLFDPNVVKVVRRLDGSALYFSRSPIPYVRDVPPSSWLEHHTFWAHIGVYGYRRDVLTSLPQVPESSLELAERLEQLRLLAAGYRIQTIETSYHPVAVDTAADLERVRGMMETHP